MIVFWHGTGCPPRANFQAKRKFFLAARGEFLPHSEAVKDLKE
jgi:hypothetical protein|tara:strand:- start:1111 stop:1239 length:129 start_codon:yes stop_codon:yes gene_type:complete